MRFFLLTLLLACTLPAWAQGPPPADTLRHFPPVTLESLNAQLNQSQPAWNRVYAQAMRLQDRNTAITALHHMLLEHPEPILYDTLLNLYYETAQVQPCLRLGQEILARNPRNTFALHILAATYESQQQLREAIDMRERLDQIRMVPWNVYQMGALQYQLGRYAEATATLNRLIAAPESATEEIMIRHAQGQDRVFLRAAAWNVLGNTEMAQNHRSAAQKAFKTALEISPGFTLARNNLNDLRTPRLPANDH